MEKTLKFMYNTDYTNKSNNYYNCTYNPPNLIN